MQDLLSMYQHHAKRQGWRFEIISSADTDAGGLREVVANITGNGVYGKLKYESGTHRVQRVPATESQGRIHTSTVTVALLPQATEVCASSIYSGVRPYVYAYMYRLDMRLTLWYFLQVDVELHERDLRIDTFRAGGAGGQHVNTTDRYGGHRGALRVLLRLI